MPEDKKSKPLKRNDNEIAIPDGGVNLTELDREKKVKKFHEIDTSDSINLNGELNKKKPKE